MRILNIQAVLTYLDCCETASGLFASYPDGVGNLYATLYTLTTRYYLTSQTQMNASHMEITLSAQDKNTGFFIGPEINNWRPDTGAMHDFEHVCMHLTSAVLPVVELFDIKPKYPLAFAYPYTDLVFLEQWLEKRDWTNAWLEGNNLFFILQFLVYLRDKENHPNAQNALSFFFDWLDRNSDPNTGLWGTNGHCSSFIVMCGGYHQLLAYYYEKRPVIHPESLIDTILELQHFDGGFSPSGGGGACEDVDAVDILVNLYKLTDYKRTHTCLALRKCLKH